MYANPAINERGVLYVYRGSGGMLQKTFEILMPRESFWCNLRLDARLARNSQMAFLGLDS